MTEAQSTNQLVGQWQVEKNTTFDNPRHIVVALDNDPAIVGNRLIFDGDKIRWIYKKSRKSEFDESCRIKSIKVYRYNRFDFICRNGEKYGPPVDEPSFRIICKDYLRVDWFDDLIIYARRVNKGHKGC